MPAFRSSSGPSPHPHHERGLLLIGILKLLKAAFFIAVGIGALRLLHKDLADLFMRVAVSLRFDPESHIVNTLLDKVALINDHRLRQISLATFAYAGVATIEGIGLMLEKVWAEYLTTILTIGFLPIELIELFRRATLAKGILISINIAVLVYLLQYIRKSRRVRSDRRIIAAHSPSPFLR